MSRFFDDKKASEKKKAALRALRDLREEEGADAVQQVYSEAVSEALKENYIKRYSLSPSSVHRNCLCRLLGKQCPWMYGKSNGCITFAGHVMDHTSLWNHEGKPHVYVSQPYGMGLEDMRSIVNTCSNYGLNVEVDSYSWYFPHAALRIQVRRK